MVTYVLDWVLVGAALFSVALYMWYLTWPVCSGVVTRVDEWTQPGNHVLRARERRCIRYEYKYKNRTHSGARQSLFLAHALSPKRQVGDRITISVCLLLPAMTCPRRPGLELVIVVIWAVFLLSVAFVGLIQTV